MAEEFVMSESIKEIAEQVIDAMPDLRHIREEGILIGYMESNHKKKSHGHTVLGDCEKVKKKQREFIPYDFLITVYAPNVEGLTMEQIKILLYHELLHVGGEREETGELRTWIVPHNIEDFHQITDRFGQYWAEEGNDLPDITERREVNAED